MDISATGPISLSKWNSFIREEYPLGPEPFNPPTEVVWNPEYEGWICCAVAEPSSGPGASLSSRLSVSALMIAAAEFFLAEIKARKKTEYKAGVWRGLTATLSKTSAVSLMKFTVFCSSTYACNSGRSN